MCFTIKYRLNREYSSPANRTLKTNLDRPSKNSTGLMSRGTSKELVFGLSYLKAPLPIKPLAILLYLDQKWSFRIFGQRPIFHKWVSETLAKQVLLLMASIRVSVRHAESSPSAPRYNKSGNIPRFVLKRGALTYFDCTNATVFEQLFHSYMPL